MTFIIYNSESKSPSPKQKARPNVANRGLPRPWKQTPERTQPGAFLKMGASKKCGRFRLPHSEKPKVAKTIKGLMLLNVNKYSCFNGLNNCLSISPMYSFVPFMPVSMAHQVGHWLSM